MSENAMLAGRVPALRINDGLVYMDVGHSAGIEVVVKMHHFMSFLDQGRQMVVDWELAQANAVVPLCEMCKRFDLPKHDDGT